MRIECCTPLGNQIELVWHVPECRRVLATWVDTDTAQYCEYISQKPWNVLTQTKQARKIVLDGNVILIDPLQDSEPDAIETPETIKQPEAV